MTKTVSIKHTECASEIRIPLDAFLSDVDPVGRAIRCPACNKQMAGILVKALRMVADGIKTIQDNNSPTENQWGDQSPPDWVVEFD